MNSPRCSAAQNGWIASATISLAKRGIEPPYVGSGNRPRADASPPGRLAARRPPLRLALRARLRGDRRRPHQANRTSLPAPSYKTGVAITARIRGAPNGTPVAASAQIHNASARLAARRAPGLDDEGVPCPPACRRLLSHGSDAVAATAPPREHWRQPAVSAVHSSRRTPNHKTSTRRPRSTARLRSVPS